MFIISMQISKRRPEVVQDTLDKYLENHSKTKSSFSFWKPVSLGGLKTGAKDWITKDYQDEMLSSAF